MIEETKPQGYPLRLFVRFLAAIWRRQRDSNPRGVAPKRFSRPPRYDRFDMPPSKNIKLFYIATVFKTRALHRCIRLSALVASHRNAHCFGRSRFTKTTLNRFCLLARYDRFDVCSADEASKYVGAFSHSNILTQKAGLVNRIIAKKLFKSDFDHNIFSKSLNF